MVKVRENFRRYWKVGFILVVVSSLIDGLLRLYMDYISSLPAQEWRYGPLLFFRIPLQSEWIVITIVVTIAVFIAVPWLYGRLAEFLHIKWIVEKKTE